MSRNPARQRVPRKPFGVSTVAPPVNISPESARGRWDRWSRSSFLWGGRWSPKSVCAEIPSSKRPRCCPPRGPDSPQGFPDPLAARREEGTARRPDLSEVLLLQPYDILLHPPPVNHLIGTFFEAWLGLRFRGRQLQRVYRGLAHFLLRPGDGHPLAAQPQGQQIGVVRRQRIARLPPGQ